MHNTVHFILQGKGGIGKTLVSTILAQWMAGQDDKPLRCFDTDQENPTFSRYKAMNVRHVPVMTDTRTIDPKRFDALMIDLLEEEGNCVIDNGANTFSPLMAYLIENDCFAMLQEAGRKVYIHVIVGGGDTLHDTATGFTATAKATTVPLVLWENQHFGLLQSASGKLFHRVADVCRLRRPRGRTRGAERPQCRYLRRRHQENEHRPPHFGRSARQREIQCHGKAAHQGGVPRPVRATRQGQLVSAMDQQKLRNLVFEKTGVRIDVDDPVFALVALNEAVLEEAVERHIALLHEASARITGLPSRPMPVSAASQRQHPAVVGAGAAVFCAVLVLTGQALWFRPAPVPVVVPATLTAEQTTALRDATKLRAIVAKLDRKTRTTIDTEMAKE